MEKKRKKIVKKNSMKKLHKDAVEHLNEDIQGYQKQRKHLKSEIKEDRDLQKKLRMKKNGAEKKSKACCKDCERGKSCAGKRKQNAKKTGRIQRRRVQKR